MRPWLRASVPYWLNTAWMWSCRHEATAFHAATCAVSHAQWNVLSEMVSRNVDTRFGHRHDFRKIRSVADFQQRVPLSCYQAYETSVTQIAEGQARVLTAEPVELLEPTSGTTSAEKLIPYTATLRRQFQRAVAGLDRRCNAAAAQDAARTSLLVDLAGVGGKAADVQRDPHRIRGRRGVPKPHGTALP